MKSLALAFAGSIASGKTTLSQRVARALGWPWVGFGECVRSEARRRELGDSREVLQELGAALIAEDLEQLCRATLAQVSWHPGEPVVIDGVRVPEAIPTLRSLVAPSELLLVYVAVDEATREPRLLARGINDPAEVRRMDAHFTEAQVRVALSGLADLAVDGDRPAEELVGEILAWAGSRT